MFSSELAKFLNYSSALVTERHRLKLNVTCACKRNVEIDRNSRLVGADAQIARQTPGDDFKIIVERRTIQERLASLWKRRKDQSAAAVASSLDARFHSERCRVARHTIATVKTSNKQTSKQVIK